MSIACVGEFSRRVQREREWNKKAVRINAQLMMAAIVIKTPFLFVSTCPSWFIPSTRSTWYKPTRTFGLIGGPARRRYHLHIWAFISVCVRGFLLVAVPHKLSVFLSFLRHRGETNKTTNMNGQQGSDWKVGKLRFGHFLPSPKIFSRFFGR